MTIARNTSLWIATHWYQLKVKVAFSNRIFMLYPTSLKLRLHLITYCLPRNRQSMDRRYMTFYISRKVTSQMKRTSSNWWFSWFLYAVLMQTSIAIRPHKITPYATYSMHLPGDNQLLLNHYLFSVIVHLSVLASFDPVCS